MWNNRRCITTYMAAAVAMIWFAGPMSAAAVVESRHFTGTGPATPLLLYNFTATDSGRVDEVDKFNVCKGDVRSFTVITVGAADDSQQGGSSGIMPFDVTSGTNRLLVVTVTGAMTPGDEYVTGVMWSTPGNAQSLTQAVASPDNGGASYADIWYLAAPDAGAGDITVTLTKDPGPDWTIGALSLYDVKQTNPLVDTSTWETGNDDEAYVNNIEGIEGGILIDAFEQNVAGRYPTPVFAQTPFAFRNDAALSASMSSAYRITTEDGVTENGWILFRYMGGEGPYDPDAERNVLAVASFAPAPPPDPALASDPDPNDFATDVEATRILSWTPGDFVRDVNEHNVYFGETRQDVIDVNYANKDGYPNVTCENRDVNNFDPSLEYGKTYYWRVDEINDVNVWKGEVWSFTVADSVIVDDMEEGYVIWGAAGLHVYDVWVDGSGNCDAISGNGTGSLVSLAGAGTSPAGPAYGVYSMKLEFDNDGMVTDGCGGGEVSRSAYSMVKTQIADLPSGIDPNWLAGGIRALSLQFCGDAGNDLEPIWVELADTDGNSAKVTYGDNPGEDTDDIKEPSWHEWNIDLQESSNDGVNLADVKTIAIGVGDPGAAEPGGSGTVYFDDIRLHPVRCLLARRDADFAIVDYVGDCVVDYKEVEMIAENWLDAVAEPPMIPITILNAGFEKIISEFPDGLTDGQAVWMRDAHDWLEWDPVANDEWVQIWNVNDDGSYFPLEEIEGDYVVYTWGDNVASSPYAGIAQITSEPFDRTKRYTLTAKVGRLTGESFNGYKVQLLAGGTEVIANGKYADSVSGGTVIAEDADSLTIPADTMVTSTVTYTPYSWTDDTLDGQNLQIRLLVIAADGYYPIAYFDDVKLSRSSGELSTVDLDLYEDMVINFKDFAVLADRFLDENGMFP